MKWLKLITQLAPRKKEHFFTLQRRGAFVNLSW